MKSATLALARINEGFCSSTGRPKAEVLQEERSRRAKAEETEDTFWRELGNLIEENPILPPNIPRGQK